jgi:hypothetical protein
MRGPKASTAAAKRAIVGQSSEGQGVVLGLSLTKILVTILIAVAVWRSFAFIGRLARDREARAVRNASKPRATARARGSGTIELVECSRCGAYFDPRQGCRCGHRPA